MFRSYALSSSSSSEDEVDVPHQPVATAKPFSLPSSSDEEDDDGMDDGRGGHHRVTAKRGTTTNASKPPFSISFDPSSSSDDDDGVDDGRGGHRVKREPPPPPPPPQPEPPARAPPQQEETAGGGKKLPKWMPAPKVEEQNEDEDEKEEEDLLGQQSASRARWLTGANSAKRAKPAAAAVPVKEKAKGGSGSRKAKDEPKVFPAAARAVKQEQEQEQEQEEGSEEEEEEEEEEVEMLYDEWGEVKGIQPDAKGPPKEERALAVWRNAVARALLEGEKEKRILESACKTLEAHLTGLAKQTDEELRVAAAAIEEGKRAALALRVLGLLEGAALAGAGVVTGRGGGKLNVWDETELPMQESGAESEAEVEMPSEAAIAELRAKVERAQQVEEEARARRLFRPEEQAPLALGRGEGGADILGPDLPFVPLPR